MVNDSASYYKTASQSYTTSGANQVVNFDTVFSDTASLVSNPSTNFKFTANQSGWWAIAAKIGFLANAGTTALAYCDLFLDIPSLSFPFKQSKSRIALLTPGAIQTINTATLIYLNSGTTVQVMTNAAWAGTAPSIYFDGIFSSFAATFVRA